MRLRIAFTVFVFTLLLPITLLAQKEELFPRHQLRHQLRLSSGIAFDDGLSLLARTPTLGLGYEYRLGKRWGAAVHLLSHFRSFGDGTFIGTPADLNAHWLRGPFLTDAELNRIQNIGIKKIRLGNPVKMLSVPVDIGLNFYPLITKRHRLGINGCLSLTYESFNRMRSASSVILELEDGTIYRDGLFSTVAQHKHWVSGLGVKLFYEYHWERLAVGLRAGNYNFFDLGADNLGRGWPVWESSLYVTAKW